MDSKTFMKVQAAGLNMTALMAAAIFSGQQITPTENEYCSVSSDVKQIEVIDSDDQELKHIFQFLVA